MKYRIISNDALTRVEKKKLAIKWIIYSVAVIFFYIIMRSGAFDMWQPIFIIPLAVAVAMQTTELPSCVFALFCGYMIDISYGFIFGFSAVWLMLVCVSSTILIRNLIKVNLFNFLVITLIAVILEFSMQYLFYVALWNVPGGEYILTNSIIPTAVSTFIASPLMYYGVKITDKKFSIGGNITYVDRPDEEKSDNKRKE